jgi:undecaprenyl-diphosphatase
MNLLQDLDYSLFNVVNGHHNPVLDFVMYWISDKWLWIPLYIWLLYAVIKEFRKKILPFILLIAGMIALSDQLSVYIKFAVQRLRPCHDPLLSDVIHLVDGGCGGKFGFLSSHASNSMSLVVLLIAVLPQKYKLVKAALLAYLILVGYSRVYLGAHFPGDVIAGWLLGAIVGITGVMIWNKINPAKA